MDPLNLQDAGDGAQPDSANRGVAAWSLERLIALLDEAIDSAGAQLARSAGLWDDSPSAGELPDGPKRRLRPQSSEARSLLEQVDRDQGMGPM